ncbi:DUF4179 domain-containing protein [Alkalihalobacterium chitinilyticum]|uniref:DUF4179 domain-containing protein n=1 Tax=Alkalihalobacterium chitinilyticum TaxID=2980103 RepID=A0ABT5VKU8_9BACI|nr:DUF4179 domain-containing protein [Alkalihalobacterium chitinilyticum]MDE5415078.1 DUF4179 domain-containing protein [Alkalihalobacterium chitinilyticum]
MSNMEKRLKEERERLDHMTAPAELEARLRGALENRTTVKKTKRKTPLFGAAAVALLFMVIVGYHYNGFAYYGKKLFGFDEVITGTLKELNDDEMGQIIDKQKQLTDGTILTVDGIMTDANQLILYYTLTNPNGLSYEEHFRFYRMTGFLTNSTAVGGQSLLNEEENEIKGMMSFEPVSPFTKELTLHFSNQWENGQFIEDTISFPYNPNQAMQTEIKQSIRKTVNVDQGKVTFHSITATPSMTVIDGKLQVDNFDRVNYALGGIELVANGEVVQQLGGGSTSTIRGYNFDIRFDALPQPLQSLELVIREFVGYETLNQTVKLRTIDKDPIPLLDDKSLWITDISTTSTGVEMTIATENDVMLDGVSIKAGDEVTELRTIDNQTELKLEDGTLLKQRTLLFDTIDEPELLIIEGMHYMKRYNETIDIPIK